VNVRHWILRLAALLVPSPLRAEWVAEWRSELWYVLRRSNREALFFCLGAFRDALWLRRNSSPNPRQRLWLQSPLRTVLFLAVAAAVSTFFFFRSPCPRIIPAHFLMIALALLTLPATTSLALGEYPTKRFRRWIFLGLKFTLIVPIVFCGTLDLAPIISSMGVQPHATLVGYVLAFRWALIDQRRRCPVCLRLLTNPTRIGQASQTFLEWYGTEFLCLKGHGLLHVPEIPTTYSTQRWQDLDPSWGSLFS